jgi:hypothetical protein
MHKIVSLPNHFFVYFFLLRINEGEIGGYRELRNKLDRSTLDAEEKGKGSKG